MKNPKRPTMNQKIRMKLLGIDPKAWFVSKDCTGCFEVVNRVSGEVRKLGS